MPKGYRIIFWQPENVADENLLVPVELMYSVIEPLVNHR